MLEGVSGAKVLLKDSMEWILAEEVGGSISNILLKKISGVLTFV